MLPVPALFRTPERKAIGTPCRSDSIVWRSNMSSQVLIVAETALTLQPPSCAWRLLTLQQRQQQPNASVQFYRQQVKGALSLLFRSFSQDWIGRIPVDRARMVEDGTIFGVLITQDDDAIKDVAAKLLQVFGNMLAHVSTEPGDGTNSQRMDLRRRMASGTEGLDLTVAEMIRERLGHLRPGAIVGAEKQ